MTVVLVVDDEEIIRAMAESFLHDAHHQTVLAANTEEAILLLQSDQTIDVLFTDLGLGHCLRDGIDLAVAARKLRPGLSVLYTSGHGVTDGMQAMFVEPFGFLAKPYTMDQLNTALGNSLRQCDKPN